MGQEESGCVLGLCARHRSNTSHILVSFMLTTTLGGKYYPAFRNEGTEERRGQVSCSELHGW